MIKRLILPARYLTLSLAMLLAGIWLGKQSDEQPTFMSVASDAVGPSENVRQIPTPSENVGLVVRNIPTLNESYAINRGFYTTEDISQMLGVTQRTVLRRIEDNEITAQKVGERWHIPLEKWNNAN